MCNYLWLCAIVKIMCKVFTQGQFWPSGIVVACVCLCAVWLCVCVCINHLLVHAITWDLFKLGSTNLDHRCKIPWLRSRLFLQAIDLDFQGHIQLQNKKIPHFELVRTVTRHPFKLGSLNLDQRCKIPLLKIQTFLFFYLFLFFVGSGGWGGVGVEGGNWLRPSSSNLT